MHHRLHFTYASSNRADNGCAPQQNNYMEQLTPCFASACWHCENVPANCSTRWMDNFTSVLDCIVLEEDYASQCWLELCDTCRVCSAAIFTSDASGESWKLTSHCGSFGSAGNCHSLQVTHDECVMASAIDDESSVTSDIHVCHCFGNKTCVLRPSFTFSLRPGGSGSDLGDSSTLPHTSPSITFSTVTTVASVTVTETSTQLLPNPTITSLTAPGNHLQSCTCACMCYMYHYGRSCFNCEVLIIANCQKRN